jgi:hypothetical protein
MLEDIKYFRWYYYEKDPVVVGFNEKHLSCCACFLDPERTMPNFLYDARHAELIDLGLIELSKEQIELMKLYSNDKFITHSTIEE